jgi:hypothetical protein
LIYWNSSGPSDDEGVNIYDFSHILCELFHAFVKIGMAMAGGPGKPLALAVADRY